MEDSVNVMKFVIFSTLSYLLIEKCLLVEGGCPRQDAGCATWVSKADGCVYGDKGVLCQRKDKPEVAVLDPATGTLD